MSRFAARGGKNGARNQRKTFGAELADPYADPDDDARPHVDAALRVVCEVSLLYRIFRVVRYFDTAVTNIYHSCFQLGSAR